MSSLSIYIYIYIHIFIIHMDATTSSTKARLSPRTSTREQAVLSSCSQVEDMMHLLLISSVLRSGALVSWGTYRQYLSLIVVRKRRESLQVRTCSKISIRVHRARDIFMVSVHWYLNSQHIRDHVVLESFPVFPSVSHRPHYLFVPRSRRTDSPA